MSELAQIDIQPRGDVVVVSLRGEIDISNVRAVKERILGALPNTALGAAVDVSATTYLDSSGVHLLFELTRALDERRQRLCVVAPPGALSTRVLVIAGLAELVPLVDTVDDGVERVLGPAPA